MVDTNHNGIEKSIIVEHSHATKHLIYFGKSKILASAPLHSNRSFWKPALEIEKQPNNFNCDDGYQLSHS